MALQAFTGFEDTVPEANWTYSNAPLGDPAGRTDRCMVSGNGSTQFVQIPCSLVSTIVSGVAMKIASNGWLVPHGPWFKIQEDSVVHLGLRWTSDGKLGLYRGATLIASAPSPYAVMGTWKYFEIKAKIHSSEGFVEVRVDEQTVISFTGNTRDGGVSGLVNSVRMNTGDTGNGAAFYFDDFYLLDTSGPAPYNDFLGDIAVKTLVPSGVGDSAQWVGSDGNSVDNHLLVDEVPAAAADYVESNTSGQIDLYSMTDIPAGYNVLAVQEVLHAVKSDGGTQPSVVPTSKGVLGAVRDDSILPPLQTGTAIFGYNGDIRTTDPDGNPLTPARVNAMQVGMKVV